MDRVTRAPCELFDLSKPQTRSRIYAGPAAVGVKAFAIVYDANNHALASFLGRQEHLGRTGMSQSVRDEVCDGAHEFDGFGPHTSVAGFNLQENTSILSITPTHSGAV